MTIELVHFQQDEFEPYMVNLLVQYKSDKIAAGNISPEDAEDKIEKEIQTLLPQGMETPNHRFFQIFDPEISSKVGIVWVYFNPEDSRNQAFIYDVEISESYRRQGYASQAMLKLEDDLRDQGVKKIGLHVFGFNTGAQALYRKLGYQVTNIQMSKQI